jgi:hypothetical protein
MRGQHRDHPMISTRRRASCGPLTERSASSPMPLA